MSAASVTVEDESTKRCSACAEDRPVSAFSSAQLKKKGKHVCSGCVNKKDAAAATQQHAATASARKESMKSAFATKLNSAPPQAASPCWCCGSKAAVRSVPCVRCSVKCCSLKCFDGHHCDAYLEARRTIPTDLIPEEDRFDGADEIVSSWMELSDCMRELPASVSEWAVQCSAQWLNNLGQLDRTMMRFAEAMELPLWEFYSPCASRPWWNQAASPSMRLATDNRAVVTSLIKQVASISQHWTAIVDQCAAAIAESSRDPKPAVHGDWLPMPTIDSASACFLPSRLLHKLLTLLRWILRTMGSEWTRAHFDQPGDVSKDAFGAFPGSRSGSDGFPERAGYLELPDPDTGVRTLVPLFGTAISSSRWCALRQHLGYRMLTMVLRDGQLVFDRGLYLNAGENRVEVAAVTGWTGNVPDSFSASQARSSYWSDQWLSRATSSPVIGDHVREEIEARKRPDYFHLIPAMKQMIPQDEWPSAHGAALFIATPQRGIESELVELSLLESLAEDAAAGNEQAQLLIAHIESECAAPIADVIARQKSRLEQMLEDQAAQLCIHAEAVKRAELRGRLKGPSTAAVDDAMGPATSASVSSSSVDAAVAPTSAASSSSSAVSAARASSSLDGPAYSWTQSREYKGLESLRAPGRKKYSTIMSAAKKLLYSLRPVSVNKKGGSHIVFHFALGTPATLVQLHAGGRSKDSTAHTTRLFAQLSEVAMQQGMAGASVIEGATEAGRHKLLQ